MNVFDMLGLIVLCIPLTIYVLTPSGKDEDE